MVNEIKFDLEVSKLVRNGRCSQTTRSDIKRDIPPMVHRRTLNEPDLSDNLRPHVQRCASILPLRKRETWP